MATVRNPYTRRSRDGRYEVFVQSLRWEKQIMHPYEETDYNWYVTDTFTGNDVASGHSNDLDDAISDAWDAVRILREHR